MPKPTRDEMAALVDLAKRLRELPIPDCVRAADALEALMQERAEPVASLRWSPEGRHEVMWITPKPPSGWLTVYAAPPAKPAGELPPLPESVGWRFRLIWDTSKPKGGWTLQLQEPQPNGMMLLEKDALHTADQMRAYALRAIQERE